MKENAFVLAQRFVHQFVEWMVKHMQMDAWLNVLKRFAINIEHSN
jgi:hypothetical protein